MCFYFILVDFWLALLATSGTRAVEHVDVDIMDIINIIPKVLDVVLVKTASKQPPLKAS
jgi:hypothetical protein